MARALFFVLCGGGGGLCVSVCFVILAAGLSWVRVCKG